MIELLGWMWGLIPLDILPPSPTAQPGGVPPQGSNGFAAGIVGGFVGLGIIIMAAVLVSLKPKRVKPPITRND